jgi:hypothetical protein
MWSPASPQATRRISSDPRQSPTPAKPQLFDIDETLLSYLAYYVQHRYG